MKNESLRLKYKDVKQFFVDQGCELLEDTYKNSGTKMKYRCSCGNKSQIIFDKFKRGSRCRLCGNRKNSEKQRLSHEEVAKYFEEQGCELLDQYTLAYNSVKYRCKCGNISKTTLNSFQKGKQCNKCGIKQRSGENHYDWIVDREEVKVRHVFRQKCYKALYWSLKLTGQLKSKRTKELLGYSSQELRDHIENNPNWGNIKDGQWQLDHIFPVKAFIDYDIKDLKLINTLDNLQPLTRSENQSKHDKYNKQEFEQWLRQKGVELK